jgi:hypothetical protein
MQATSVITSSELSEQLGLVISTTHSLYDEQRRIVIRAAAAELADPPEHGAYPVVRVADALRDWLRDDAMPMVVDAGTYHLRGEWRRDRDAAARAGVNVREHFAWRSWDDSIPDGLQLLAKQLLGYVLSSVDWRAEALEALGSNVNGVRVEHLAETLAAIMRAERGPHTDPTGTGSAEELVRLELRELTGTEATLTSEELAERVHYLSELGLAGSRFVGGSSGTLVHSSGTL